MGYSGTDFIHLGDCPLAWRWERIPGTARLAIRPLREDVSERLRPLAVRLDPGHGPDVVEIDAATSPATVSTALRALGVPSEAEVVAWWPWGAVVVPWHVFAEYWDDFCYPSSDDLTVWPSDQQWSLGYDHDERFRFRRRAAAG
jgi:hypothetical protein